MTRVLLGMGSNLGDRRSRLREAVSALSGVTAVSGVYETEPVGGPRQGAFLNIVVALESDLEPEKLPREMLGVCQRLEAAAERTRDVRWGPRTLDVDILWIDGVRIDEPDLQIPHPRMFERRFVVSPLSEVAPDLVSEEQEALAQGRVERLGPLGDDPLH